MLTIFCAEDEVTQTSQTVFKSDVVSLSVALFGMFIWVIVPPARDNRVIGALVAASFAASFACTYLPLISDLSGGTRTIILTVVIATIGAILHPINDENAPKKGATDHAA